MTQFETIYLEKLLQENSGLLSRMKERDGNDDLAKILDESYKSLLTGETKRAIINSQTKENDNS